MKDGVVRVVNVYVQLDFTNFFMLRPFASYQIPNFTTITMSQCFDCQISAIAGIPIYSRYCEITTFYASIQLLSLNEAIQFAILFVNFLMLIFIPALLSGFCARWIFPRNDLGLTSFENILKLQSFGMMSPGVVLSILFTNGLFPFLFFVLYVFVSPKTGHMTIFFIVQFLRSLFPLFNRYLTHLGYPRFGVLEQYIGFVDPETIPLN